MSTVRAAAEGLGMQILRLKMGAGGLHVREISDDLGISVHTVRSHIRNIFEILKVSSQLEAVAKALRERLI